MYEMTITAIPILMGPGDSAPKAFNNAAASSLGCSIRNYLQTASLFRCPSTKDKPAFVLKGERPNQTWLLTGSSYGYDPRVLRTTGKDVGCHGGHGCTYAYSRDIATPESYRMENVLSQTGM